MIFGILLVFVFLLTTDGGNEGEVITRSPLGRFWDCPRLPGIHKILSHLTFTKISNKRYTNTQILQCNIDILTGLPGIQKILSHLTFTKISQSH